MGTLRRNIENAVILKQLLFEKSSTCNLNNREHINSFQNHLALFVLIFKLATEGTVKTLTSQNEPLPESQPERRSKNGGY
jgi:hypothetical protein